MFHSFQFSRNADLSQYLRSSALMASNQCSALPISQRAAPIRVRADPFGVARALARIASGLSRSALLDTKYSCGRTLRSGRRRVQIARQKIEVFNQRLLVENSALEHCHDGLTIFDVLVPLALIILQCRIMLNSAALFNYRTIADSLLHSIRSLPSAHFGRRRQRYVLVRMLQLMDFQHETVPE